MEKRLTQNPKRSKSCLYLPSMRCTHPECLLANQWHYPALQEETQETKSKGGDMEIKELTRNQKQEQQEEDIDM